MSLSRGVLSSSYFQCRVKWQAVVGAGRSVHFVRSVSSQSPRMPPSGGPLCGVRVLDLTRILAGPFMTMLLGDLGAEVIKVERPDCGDDTRGFGPPFKGSESVYFMSINRSKKSIAVNVKSKRGQEIVQELAAKSDVLVENYVPGKLDSLGLGYDALKQVNPGLVYCSITGYGSEGPKSGYLGYDVVAAAESGLMHVTGPQVHLMCVCVFLMYLVLLSLYDVHVCVYACHLMHTVRTYMHR